MTGTCDNCGASSVHLEWVECSGCMEASDAERGELVRLRRAVQNRSVAHDGYPSCKAFELDFADQQRALADMLGSDSLGPFCTNFLRRTLKERTEREVWKGIESHMEEMIGASDRSVEGYDYVLELARVRLRKLEGR